MHVGSLTHDSVFTHNAIHTHREGDGDVGNYDDDDDDDDECCAEVFDSVSWIRSSMNQKHHWSAFQ